MEWDNGRFFTHKAASAYHVISKKVENQIFRHNWIFRQHVRTNKPHWQSSGIIIFLWKYYIVISDTLVGFFFDVLFLLLAVLLSELYEKPRRKKDWVTEKSTKKNLRERHQFFDCTPFLLSHFLLLSSSTLLPKWRTCCMTTIKIQNISMGGILCGMENMKKLAGWHL